MSTRLSSSTSTRFNLKVFALVLNERKTPRKASFYHFSRKKVRRLFMLKEVKPPPDSKMIKLLAFDNFFLPLRPYDPTTATSPPKKDRGKKAPYGITKLNNFSTL